MYYKTLIIILICNTTVSGWLEKLTKMTLLDYLGCKLGYCCNPTYIPADVEGLRSELNYKLYGQHLVIDTLVNAIKDHWELDVSQKALTLSLHGSPGTGKNYVVNFIRKHLFAYPAFTHQFSGRVHFPLEKKVPEYKEDLKRWIRGNMTICNKQLFVFDEVEKIPTGLLNVIKPMIDYNMIIDGIDYRKSIFIFLSNTGQKNITEKILQLWKQGIKREEFRLHHFEKMILDGAFNEPGGFHLSDNIKSNLIDHYIPFLPLEQQHVRLCIHDEFKKRNIYEVKEEHIEEILNVVAWGPKSHKVFSNTGCKRISQKVGLYVSQFYSGKSQRSEL